MAGCINLLDHLTDAGWKAKLAAEFTQPYFQSLENQLQAEYKASKQIFPPKNEVFNAFNLTPIDKVLNFLVVKCVIASSLENVVINMCSNLSGEQVGLCLCKTVVSMNMRYVYNLFVCDSYLLS